MRLLTTLLILVLAIQAEYAQAQLVAWRPVYVNYTEFGGLFGRVASGPATAQTVENRLSFTAQTFNGAQVTRRLAVGGVVSLDWYKAALLLPLGAGIRFDLTNPNAQRNVRLLAIADAGYGFGWLHKGSTGYTVKGGWMLNPGLGLRLGRSSSAFVMSLTYKRQATDVEKPLLGNDVRRDEHRVYNRLCFRAGIAF